jgi:hypothetical protein
VSKTKEKEIISPFKKVVSKIARKERDIEIATNMLKNNEPIEKICSYTNLLKKEVEELKTNLK